MSRAAQILFELQRLGIKQPTTLDFGCGTGWFTSVISQFGNAVGVDLAPDAARRFHPDLAFHDIDHFPTGPFDVVVSQEVIEHVPDQASYRALAHRALRPGGYLILTTPNAKVSLKNPQFLVKPQEKHLHRNELQAIFATDFHVERLYTFLFGYAGWRPYRMQFLLGRQLDAGLHSIAVCRKHETSVRDSQST